MTATGKVLHGTEPREKRRSPHLAASPGRLAAGFSANLADIRQLLATRVRDFLVEWRAGAVRMGGSGSLEAWCAGGLR
jgi:hypothetical protein